MSCRPLHQLLRLSQNKKGLRMETSGRAFVKYVQGSTLVLEGEKADWLLSATEGRGR